MGCAVGPGMVGTISREEPRVSQVRVGQGDVLAPANGAPNHPVVRPQRAELFAQDRFERTATLPNQANPQNEGPRSNVYDVSTVPDATINRLRTSNNPTERNLGNTIANARTAYADQIRRGARVVVTTSAGNGGQPVLTLMGPGFDPNKPARVHTHYHGDNATVADPRGSFAGTNQRMEEVQRRDPQTVFVLPEVSNAPSRVPSSYAANWGNAQSQVQTTQDALRAAGITNVGKQIVSAHSRGGSALARIIERDPTGAGLRADRLEIHDSLYGSENQLKRWAATNNGRATSSVLYYRGSNTPGRDSGLEQAFRNNGYQRIDMANQGPMRPDGRYYPDPHYRVIGEFLDSMPGP